MVLAQQQHNMLTYDVFVCQGWWRVITCYQVECTWRGGLGAGIQCLPTLLVSWVSIMNVWTCFSARVSSSFLASTATTSAVHPAPCKKQKSDTSCLKLVLKSSPHLTRLLSCVSIIKLCTCFSARESSNFLAKTATTRAVQPEPWKKMFTLVIIVYYLCIFIMIDIVC